MTLEELLVAKNILSSGQLNICKKALKDELDKGNHRILEQVIEEQGFAKEEDIVNTWNKEVIQRDIYAPNYKILEKVGQGAMGLIYKGMQSSLNRPVAIKVMSEELSEQDEFIERFRKEAKVIGQLSHTNIVRGFDFGDRNGVYYFVMEYIEGQPLEDIVKSIGALKEASAILIMMHMGKALRHLHEKHFVHRDIKPENIMFNKDLGTKLCDLGLADSKSVFTQDGETEEIYGTPDYMSPEQARGDKNIDIRSDIYSLGATCFYLLSGRPPYEAESSAAIASMHLTSPVPKITNFRKDLSPWWDKFFAKCMAKDLNNRIQTPDQFLEILDAYRLAKK